MIPKQLVLSFAIASCLDVNAEIAHFAVIHDASRSAGTGCEQFAQAFDTFLPQPSGAETTVLAFTTGSSATALEPRQFFGQQLRGDRHLVGGKEKNAAVRRQLVDNARRACESNVKNVSVSAIYNAVRSVVEDFVHSGACNAANRCAVVVRTDAEETAIPELSTALHGRKARIPVPKINNENVPVIFCDIANTVGIVQDGQTTRSFTSPRGPAHRNLLRDVWTNSFTHPETVQFLSFCSMGHPVF